MLSSHLRRANLNIFLPVGQELRQRTLVGAVWYLRYSAHIWPFLVLLVRAAYLPFQGTVYFYPVPFPFAVYEVALTATALQLYCAWTQCLS